MEETELVDSPQLLQLYKEAFLLEPQSQKNLIWNLLSSERKNSAFEVVLATLQSNLYTCCNFQLLREACIERK